MVTREKVKLELFTLIEHLLSRFRYFKDNYPEEFEKIHNKATAINSNLQGEHGSSYTHSSGLLYLISILEGVSTALDRHQSDEFIEQYYILKAKYDLLTTDRE